ncbi:MAG: hypothetical protein KAI72_08820, partial [Candidatus Pacebacteria bacterium]|nr:hypothetical protein [Candidatus Paceibacterota bacterium]
RKSEKMKSINGKLMNPEIFSDDDNDNSINEVISINPSIIKENLSKMITVETANKNCHIFSRYFI